MDIELFRKTIKELCKSREYRKRIMSKVEPLPAELDGRELGCIEACGEQAGHVGPQQGPVQQIDNFRAAITRLCTDPDYRKAVLNHDVSLKDDYDLNESQMIVLEEAGKCAGHIKN